MCPRIKSSSAVSDVSQRVWLGTLALALGAIALNAALGPIPRGDSTARSSPYRVLLYMASTIAKRTLSVAISPITSSANSAGFAAVQGYDYIENATAVLLTFLWQIIIRTSRLIEGTVDWIGLALWDITCTIGQGAFDPEICGHGVEGLDGAGSVLSREVTNGENLNGVGFTVWDRGLH